MQCLAMYYHMQDRIHFAAIKTGLEVLTAS